MNPPDFAADLAGLLADHYVFDRELGRGGMGVVWLARDIRLDRLVAVKVLPPALMADEVLRQRFLREARTAAQLSHPNIVPVYQADQVGGFAFFVMGYVDGESLAERLKRLGALSPAETVRILRQAAWALAYAHLRGVVHRDVKPENLMLEKGSGRVVVTDFGIARDAAATPLTTDGQVMGSVHYMSPEQIAGDPLDGRSDLYALGVIGFRCLAGRLPFDAALASAVIVQHATEAAPPLRRIAPEVPATLAEVIDRCLAKDPADRYGDGEALAEALAAALAQAESAPGAGLPDRQVSEEEARAIWERAAQLQAEAATRLQARYRATGPAAQPTPATGYRLRQVEQAAVEAGIGAEWVSLAVAERHDGAAVVAAAATDREDRQWTRFLGTDQRTINVAGAVAGTPREVLETIGRVFPAFPYQLELRDTVGGHPLDGGVMVFSVPRLSTGQTVGAQGISMFAYRMTQIELHLLNVTVRPLPQGGTEVRCYGDLRPGLKRNWSASKTIASVSGLLGAGGAAAVALGPMALAGALAIGPALFGAAALGGGALGWYRWLYRHALRNASAQFEELIARLDAERRAKAVFGRPVESP